MMPMSLRHVLTLNLCHSVLKLNFDQPVGWSTLPLKGTINVARVSSWTLTNILQIHYMHRGIIDRNSLLSVALLCYIQYVAVVGVLKALTSNLSFFAQLLRLTNIIFHQIYTVVIPRKVQFTALFSSKSTTSFFVSPP